MMTKETEIKIIKLLEDKNYSEVLEICDKILSINEDAIAYFYKAISKFDLGKYEEAMKYQNKAIKLNPNNAELYNIMGNYKAKLGEYREAIKNYDKAIKIEPNNEDYYFNRGNANANLNLNNEAIKNYDIAIKLSSNDILAYYNRGTSKGLLGFPNEAIEDFNKVIELINSGLNLYYNTESYRTKLKLDAYSNRGFSNFLLGNYIKAIEDFDKVIELNPNLARAYYNRGLNKDCLGLYEDAIIDFNRYVELIKNHKTIEIVNIVGSFFYDIKIGDIEYIFNQLIKADYNNLWERDIIFNLLKNKIKNENIFNDIKEVLLYQYLLLHSLSFSNIFPNSNCNIKISHYTSLNTLLKLINDKNEENNESRIRLTNISNVNDPKEGKILESIFNKNGLNIKIDNKENLITFQTSFTRNKDALTMFRLYGKNENKDATGICLVLDKEYFSDNPSQFSNLVQRVQENEKNNSYMKNKQKRYLYWVIYYNEKDNILVFNPHNSKYSNIIIDLNNFQKLKIRKEDRLNNKGTIIRYIFYNIFNYVEKLNKQIKDKELKEEIFSNLFENIKYVIKHEAFFEEQELRMLITTNYKNENIKVDNKRLYINYNELFNENENFIKEIILGNKIENKELMADYIKQIIYNKYKDNHKMNEIKVSVSKAPLR